MNPKERAAQAAMELIESGMVIGLGTGSTADFFLQALGKAIRDGTVRDIRGIPTSLRSQQRSLELKIPLVELADVPRLDITVDGADEVTDDLGLIKGLGGALLREKIVAQNSRRLIIIADVSKRVAHLGTHAPLPVEVARFAHRAHEPFLRDLGCQPILRMTALGEPFQTDNGNYIYDCRFPGGIEHPQTLEKALHRRAGIVETGLFLGLANSAFIADNDQVIRLNR